MGFPKSLLTEVLKPIRYLVSSLFAQVLRPIRYMVSSLFGGRTIYHIKWDASGSPVIIDKLGWGEAVKGDSGNTVDTVTWNRVTGSGLEMHIKRPTASGRSSVGGFVPNPMNKPSIHLKWDRTYLLEATFTKPVLQDPLTEAGTLWVVGVEARVGTAMVDGENDTRLAATTVFNASGATPLVNLNLPRPPMSTILGPIVGVKKINGIDFTMLKKSTIPFTVGLEFNLSTRSVRALFTHDKTSNEVSCKIVPMGALDDISKPLTIAGANMTIEDGVRVASVVCTEFKVTHSYI
jgi:hypothetical protein